MDGGSSFTLHDTDIEWSSRARNGRAREGYGLERDVRQIKHAVVTYNEISFSGTWVLQDGRVSARGSRSPSSSVRKIE